MCKSKFKLISSLEKIMGVFPDDVKEFNSGSMLKNEQYSFQAVIKFSVDEWYARGRIEVESPINEYITLYTVENVPCMRTHIPRECADDDFISKIPTVLPDPLCKVEDNTYTYEVYDEGVIALWIAVEPQSKISGRFDINIKVYDKNDEVIATLTHNLNIIDCELPEQKLVVTGWFHGDAIAAIHDVEVDSDKYWELTEKYLKTYTRFGYNMILTPIFTPPLDTAVGAERLTNQLIGITVTEGKYTFDFTKLDFWIDLCHKHGIKYFEIAHLFTQWGAEFCPKIMATVDGEYKRIFGWEVKALSEEYKGFLGEFLPQLVDFLKSKGVYDKSFFHLSDEPNEKHFEQYGRVSRFVRQYIDFDRMIETLSDYEYYENGSICNPIPPNDHINQFLDNKVENLWTYYCGCQGNKVANRMIAMPSYRNRVLGCQMYKYNIKGFLHWGYNFWFTSLAKRKVFPYSPVELGYRVSESFPSGDSFSIYPLCGSGDPVPSLRIFVFNEALQDVRALQLLEELTDRATVEALLTDINRFDEYPRNTEYYVQLRSTINKMIEENI